MHLFARAVELRLRDAVGAEALELVADERERALLRLTADGGGDAEHAAVEKARRVGVDGVAQAVFLAHGLKQARGHVPAEDGREQRHGEALLRPRRQAGKADADLVLLDGLALEREGRGVAAGPHGQIRPAGQPRKVRGEARDVLIREAAGHGDNDARRDIVRDLKRAQARTCQPVDRGRASEHRPPQRAGEGGADEPLRDQILRRVGVHVHLLADDAAFVICVRLGKVRCEEHLGKQVARAVEVLVEHARIVARALARGVGVHLAADGVHAFCQLRGGVLCRPLEEHMLDKVRAAGLARRLIP